MSKSETSLIDFAKEVEKSNHVTVSSDRSVIKCPHWDGLRICSAELVSSENSRMFRCRKPIAVRASEDEMVVTLDSSDESCPCSTACQMK